MLNQNVKLPNVEYEMLIELAQKNRQKPLDYLSKLIKEVYNGRK